MFRKFWRFLKSSSQNSNPSLPAIEVPPSAIDVEKDEGDEEVDSEAKMWFDRGEEQYDREDFERAIASYDKALEIKPDYHEAWNRRGMILCDNLKQYENAIASFNKALEIKPDFHRAWHNRGVALSNLGKPKKALASYDKALEIKTDYHYSWHNRGIILCDNLKEYKKAIASFDKALKIKPDFYEAWHNRGVALSNLGKSKKAIASYERALKIEPDYHYSWHNRGIILRDTFKKYEEAISSFDKALEIKPDYHYSWNRRGIILCDNLKKYEEAIASFDKALKIQPDFHHAWHNRGVALYNLGRWEEAIASYDKALELKPDFRSALKNRTIALKQLRIVEGEISYYDKDYQKQVSAFKESLRHCQKNTQPEEWGKLHQALGNAHYRRGRWNSHDFYWNQAVKHYSLALETLTKSTFVELHLDVLKDLIKTFIGLDQTDRANQLSRDATHLLQRLLQQQNYSQLTQQQLTDKLVRFEQLTVNILIESGQFAEALATAETDKNVCLSWLLYALPTPDYETAETVTHAQIQQLLNPETAAIYWHLSDAALTTFIIKSDGLLSPENCLSDFPDEFEEWVKEWNKQYINYQSQEKASQLNHPWRAGMASKFDRLKEILKIGAIEQQLEGITDLILIPHRDLHRFPIHALFSRDLAISYLPSAAVGINLKQRFAEISRLSPSSDPPKSPLRRGTLSAPILSSQTETLDTQIPPSQTETLNTQIPPSQTETLNTPVPPFLRGARGDLSILSIENPHSVITDKNDNQKNFDPLPDAEIESEIICRMFPNSTRLGENEVTLDRIETLLQQPHDIFHFTGHGSYNFDNPLKSTLYLSGSHRLTVREIVNYDLSNYQLICISACETALTDKQTILAEYVGLTSAFMRAGVASVVSTLWPVESGASTLLMIYFYRQWREAGQPLRVALKNAQKWLREATREDLATWYQQEIDKISENSPELSEVEFMLSRFFNRNRQALATMELDTPYQHPYYWAAFTITGL